MVLQEKDREILSFIRKFHCVKTKHIMMEFYNECKQARYLTCRKMKKLWEGKFVKRNRNLFEDYIYYFNKSKQERHHLIVADLYFKLKECGKLDCFDVECVIEDIRPDTVCKLEYGKDEYWFCFEVHLSNNDYKDSIEKYKNLYYSGMWKKYFEWFPIVVFISDKGIKLEDDKDRLIFIKIDEDLENIEDIFI